MIICSIARVSTASVRVSAASVSAASVSAASVSAASVSAASVTWLRGSEAQMPETRLLPDDVSTAPLE